MSSNRKYTTTMMTYTRETAVQMVGTVLLDHNLVTEQGLHDASPALNARSQAADLLDEYGMNTSQDVEENVPATLVQDVISGLLDEVEERTGERPEMPVAFTTFRC